MVIVPWAHYYLRIVQHYTVVKEIYSNRQNNDNRNLRKEDVLAPGVKILILVNGRLPNWHYLVAIIPSGLFVLICRPHNSIKH